MTTLLTSDQRAQWLAERKTGIGASDAASILGLGPFGSPFSVWLDKTSNLPDEATEAMEWGLRLEEPIARAWQDAEHKRVEKVEHGDGRPMVLRHPEHPIMICTLDRVCEDGNPLEIKTANAWDDGWDPDGDRIPDHVRLQQQHQMAVKGAPLCYGAVLIAGQKFRTWVTMRDDAIIADLIIAEERFWTDYVLANKPPPMDGHRATTDAIKALWPESEAGLEVDLPFGAMRTIHDLVDAKARGKAAKADEDTHANTLKALLGDAEVGRIDGTKAVTWRSHDVAEHTVAAFTSRPLLLDKRWKP